MRGIRFQSLLVRGSRRAALCAALAVLSLPGAVRASELWRPITIDGAVARWISADASPRHFTYAIARSTVSDREAINCRQLAPPERLQTRSGISPQKFRDAVHTAFGRWAAVSNLSFSETANEAEANILIGEQIDASGHAFTNLDLGPVADGGERAIHRAKICLNPTRRWKSAFDGDLTSYDLAYTLTHEIGHAIGLDHPSARGHVMSFRYDESRTTLSAGDVSGVTAMYGPPSPATPLTPPQSPLRIYR